MIHSKVTVVFCGEEHSVSPEAGLTIGRSGDLEIDDNPYLHRTFLVVSFDNGFWWLSNTGSTLTATVADEQGLFQAWLSPGARIPLAMKTLVVWFTAGPTTYDFEIHVASPVFQSVTSDLPETGRPAAPPTTSAPPRSGACRSPRTSASSSSPSASPSCCAARPARARSRRRPPLPSGSAGP